MINKRRRNKKIDKRGKEKWDKGGYKNSFWSGLFGFICVFYKLKKKLCWGIFWPSQSKGSLQNLLGKSCDFVPTGLTLLHFRLF